MITMLSEVCQALGFVKCEPVKVEGGYHALVWLDISRFKGDQSTSLTVYLTGKIDVVSARFNSYVVDNFENPVLFDSDEEALNEAQERAKSLPKQFIYGIYAEHGVIIDYVEPQTVFFKPRKKS